MNDPYDVTLLPQENIYGHRKRLEWILTHLEKNDRVLELGCGTGYMITRPLLKLGYDAHGVDLDEKSIEFGRRILEREGLSPDRLRNQDLERFPDHVDVIIASEVLEHIHDEGQTAVFSAIRRVLAPQGRLLVTVPNGHGWFELESFLYFKTGLGYLLKKSRVDQSWRKLIECCGAEPTDGTPSTLADSPHVQFFTRKSITDLLVREGFVVEEVRQTVLFAGPLSNLLCTGIHPFMHANRKLGDLFSELAAGFLLACQVSHGKDGTR